MINKFRKWVILPAYAEVIISANSDEEALKIANKIDLKTISWQEHDVVEHRTTYEVVEDGQDT